MSNTWKSVLVSPSATADEALRILDAGGLRVALVVDHDERLVGIVTDGDIRRALLRKASFNVPVAQIMNPTPFTAPVGSRREALRALMEQRGMLFIPLLDSEGHLVGLETFRDLMGSPSRDNWVFLMAGGQGSRLGQLTENCPKPLLPVGGKPIIESILENFIAAGYHRFYISLHYLAEKIKDYLGDGSRWGITIRYIEEESPLGTGGALGLLPNVDECPIVMMNGDVLTRMDFNAMLDFHHRQHAALTLCVRAYDMQVPFGVVDGSGAVVTGIVEKPMHRFFVNAGVYVISPEVISQTQPPRRIDMPDLIKQLIEEGRKVSMFPIHEYWIDIGRPDDFKRAQVDMLSD